jgi:hypothetical protein
MQKFPVGKYLAVNASLYDFSDAFGADVKLRLTLDFLVCNFHTYCHNSSSIYLFYCKVGCPSHGASRVPRF